MVCAAVELRLSISRHLTHCTRSVSNMFEKFIVHEASRIAQPFQFPLMRIGASVFIARHNECSTKTVLRMAKKMFFFFVRSARLKEVQFFFTSFRFILFSAQPLDALPPLFASVKK